MAASADDVPGWDGAFGTHAELLEVSEPHYPKPLGAADSHPLWRVGSVQAVQSAAGVRLV